MWTICTALHCCPTWGPPSAIPPYTVSLESCTHLLQTILEPKHTKNRGHTYCNQTLEFYSDKTVSPWHLVKPRTLIFISSTLFYKKKQIVMQKTAVRDGFPVCWLCVCFAVNFFFFLFSLEERERGGGVLLAVVRALNNSSAKNNIASARIFNR